MLKGSDCNSALTSANINLAASSPFGITASEKNAAGYNEEFCLSCDVKAIGSNAVSFTRLLTVKANAAADCSAALTDA